MGRADLGLRRPEAADQQFHDHQGDLATRLVPLLLLDVWEHSSHLDHQNVEADCVKAWWNVVNRADVGQRLERARTATSGLIVPA